MVRVVFRATTEIAEICDRSVTHIGERQDED